MGCLQVPFPSNRAWGSCFGKSTFHVWICLALLTATGRSWHIVSLGKLNWSRLLKFVLLKHNAGIKEQTTKGWGFCYHKCLPPLWGHNPVVMGKFLSSQNTWELPLGRRGSEFWLHYFFISLQVWYEFPQNSWDPTSILRIVSLKDLKYPIHAVGWKEQWIFGLCFSYDSGVWKLKLFLCLLGKLTGNYISPIQSKADIIVASALLWHLHSHNSARGKFWRTSKNSVRTGSIPTAAFSNAWPGNEDQGADLQHEF